jgi:recombination protein RecA
VGGVPRSRITEIYGPEGGGKTTLAQHIVAECQKAGGTAVYIDMEHAVDLAYMAECGVDIKAVLFSQPDSGTDTLNVVRKLVASNTVDLIVVDSVAALTSAAELDADAADQFVGVQARMLSQNLKTIAPILGLSKTALVFINQTRMKIGVMYGNPETTPGGMANSNPLPSLHLRRNRGASLLECRFPQAAVRDTFP